MAPVRQLWDEALNLLYPAACCGCGRPTARREFCRSCRAEIHTPRSPLCLVCGAPFGTAGGADHRCERCLTRAFGVGRARACALYDAADTVQHPLKSVLQRYKYNRDVGLAQPLGQLLSERCPVVLGTYDVIMPVPLHVSRLRWRGFNQAQLLAKPLARRARVPMDALSMERVRPTRPQVELTEGERRHNVAHAFRVTRPERVHQRKILLVDDVYTTGATVDECSRELRRAGAASVDVLVLARAVLH
jgi:ComF family protein